MQLYRFGKGRYYEQDSLFELIYEEIQFINDWTQIVLREFLVYKLRTL